jgi:hypothetical protein
LSNSDRWLPVSVLAYAASSLFHHIHNAQFLDEYPNLPVWLSRGGVYAAWCAVTAIGVGGVACLRKGRRLAGLLLLAVYGACGLYGLAHYVVAPVSAHTMAANVSIWLEVITAFLLVGLVATRIVRAWRHGHERPCYPSDRGAHANNSIGRLNPD